ncbi:hypothetical protein LMH77_07415 [Vibrio lentus]|uniref:HNH endonuclease n=1 Tax=Vibrio kanaloae TaxID=170673 RepID=A0A4V5R842_9VIBR|nr:MULTISPECIES: hypothetical protein [Vibrio]MCC4782724.1 hypothetical protein [Vibrio lentus]TKF32268.1 hypothetical protein FCV50_09900 [Vibrio kanaloae]
MIKIEREKVCKPVSLDLSRERSAANNELRNNAVLLERGDSELSFSAYSQPSVKDAVKELTGSRCAYCGIMILRSDVSIEHYRPKGLVITSTSTKIKPGYHWLAPIWENLLPSCDFCNVGGLHEVIDFINLAASEYAKVESDIGKKNFFPVLNEDRVTPLRPGREQQEYPLLFNPCNDDPIELFSYYPIALDGENYLVVKPNNNLEDDDLKQRAETTIRLLGLNHLELAHERYDRIRRCKLAVSEMSQVLEANFNENTFKSRTVDILEFVSSARNGSFIGLCQRLAKNVIIASVRLLVDHELVDEMDDEAVLDDYICILEEYCIGYVAPVDIGIL